MDTVPGPPNFKGPHAQSPLRMPVSPPHCVSVTPIDALRSVVIWSGPAPRPSSGLHLPCVALGDSLNHMIGDTNRLVPVATVAWGCFGLFRARALLHCSLCFVGRGCGGR
jgi:hypothetical protein